MRLYPTVDVTGAVPTAIVELASHRRRMPNGDPVRIRYALMLALAVAVGCSSPRNASNPAPPAASHAQSAAPGTRRADGSYLLFSFPASKETQLTYEVVLAPCGSPACPIQARLVAGGGVAD